MWIFVEALYLQILISVSVFMEKNRIKWFMLLGWCEYGYHGYVYIYIVFYLSHIERIKKYRLGIKIGDTSRTMQNKI